MAKRRRSGRKGAQAPAAAPSWHVAPAGIVVALTAAVLWIASDWLVGPVEEGARNEIEMTLRIAGMIAVCISVAAFGRREPWLASSIALTLGIAVTLFEIAPAIVSVAAVTIIVVAVIRRNLRAAR